MRGATKSPKFVAICKYLIGLGVASQSLESCCWYIPGLKVPYLIRFSFALSKFLKHVNSDNDHYRVNN